MVRLLTIICNYNTKIIIGCPYRPAHMCLCCFFWAQAYGSGGTLLGTSPVLLACITFRALVSRSMTPLASHLLKLRTSLLRNKKRLITVTANSMCSVSGMIGFCINAHILKKIIIGCPYRVTHI